MSEATIISVDLPAGRFGGGYPKFKENFYKSFATNKQKMFLLREDSHNPNTYEKVKTLLGDHKLDFLFIDGDHSYEGVKTDFELYSPLVKKGGIIGFHDIAKHPEEWGVGVDKYWNEIKHNYTYQEFIEDKHQCWAGIGVIEQN